MSTDAIDEVRCPHGERCGGCDHLGVPYAVQLAHKRALAREALAPYPRLSSVEVPEVRAASPIAGYRTRVKWMVGPGGRLGLFERGGHRVVDTPACAVADPLLVEAGEAIRARLRDPAHAAVARAARAVDLRAVEPPSGERGALATIVLVREERPSRRALAAFARDLRAADGSLRAVWASFAPKRAIQVLGDEPTLLEGEAPLSDRQGAIFVDAAPGGFVQAHRGQAAALAAAIVEGAARVRPRPRVLELFAGAAPFGLALARAGCDVTVVESFAPAREGALRAAGAQGLALRAEEGDADAALARLVRAGARFDVVVVDPPRRGLSPATRRAIAALAPRAVAYVSCAPTTLARDLEHLAWLGFAARRVEPWDLIPLTEHVEALCWLSPSAPPSPTVLAAHPAARLVAVPAHMTALEAAARAAPEGWSARSPLPAGATGVVSLAGGPTRLGRAQVLAAVRGRPRPGLLGAGATLVVRAAGPGRSLVAIELADAAALDRLPAELARRGHPVLGDPRDGPTQRHLLERFGVDRPLLHVASLEIAEPALRGDAALAPDLAAALPPLGLGAAESKGHLGGSDRAPRGAP